LPSHSSTEYAKRLEAQDRDQLVQMVAWEGKEPVGRGHVLYPGHRDWSINAHREGCPEVRDIWVAPSHRRRGVASAIMAALERIVRERGDARVGLSVAQDGVSAPARALYEHLGYRPAHGPYIATTMLPTDQGGRPVGAVFVYVVKEL
jgi:GNAT superfamily N-acetyltransferase